MKVAINGLGRIGRATFRILKDHSELELVAVNDLVPVETLSYLLRFDTVYGRLNQDLQADGDQLIVDGTRIPVFSEKDPANLPWQELGVDLVFECSGVFTERPDLEKHLRAGAEHVLLSAPPKSEGVPMVVHGVTPLNGVLSEPIVSTASCTTNCVAPIMEVLDRRLGIRKSLMTTVHAYTTSQRLVDGPEKKLRRGRAAAANMVPTTTGAARATTKSVRDLTQDFDGIAVRVPMVCGSLADIVLVTSRQTSIQEVNDALQEESQTERYADVLGVSQDELVSSDIIGDSHGVIVDASMTQVVGGDLVKVLGWYDNEWGYASQMVRHALVRAGAHSLSSGS